LSIVTIALAVLFSHCMDYRHASSYADSRALETVAMALEYLLEFLRPH